MACMSLVGGFMPKSTFFRMPNTRLCYLLQRRTLIISSASHKPGRVSQGDGPKINGASKPKDTPKEKSSASHEPGPVSQGDGPKTNGASKPLAKDDTPKEKLSTSGSFDSEKEDKKKSEEKVEEGTKMNKEASTA